MYKEFNDYHPENGMNNDEQLLNFVSDITNSTEKYIDSIDTDNLLAVFISMCKMIGEVKGIKTKEFKRGLKRIIDSHVRE